MFSQQSGFTFLPIRHLFRRNLDDERAESVPAAPRSIG